MHRFILPAAAILAAPPALAADTAADTCARTSAIVADAVAQRADGAAKARTVSTLESGDIAERFIPAVQPLVDWVYTLPEEQLTDAAPAAFEEACRDRAG